MMRKLISLYSILLGSAVLVMWIRTGTSQLLPEGKIELAFHLASEFIMAGICIAGGVLLLNKVKYAERLNAVGLGMVLCSVLNAAGYYGENGNQTVMIVFSFLFILPVVAALKVIHLKTA